MHRVVTAMLVIALASAPALGMLAPSAQAAVRGDDRDDVGEPCFVAPEPTPLATGTEVDPRVIPTVDDADQTKVRDLGRDRSRVNVVVPLRVSEPLAEGVESLNVSVGQFRRADGYALEPEQVVARATIDRGSRRQTVELTVCVDPRIELPLSNRLFESHAGSFTGTVLIDDPRVSGGGATFTVNTKFTPHWSVVVASALSGFAGLVIGLVMASGLSLETLFTSKENMLRAATAILAGIAAVYGVYAAQYQSDPSWQGDSALFLTLAVSCAGAAYAAGNFAGSVGRVDPEKGHVGLETGQSRSGG